MVLRVSALPRKAPRNRHHSTEVRGNEELVIDVSAKGSSSVYDASVIILSSGGRIELKGNHFHELVKALLRYSDRDFKQVLYNFLAITNDAAGGLPLEALDLTEARKSRTVQIEADSRAQEKRYNDMRRPLLLEEDY